MILNDSGYGMVKYGQRMTGAEEIGVDLPKTNFASFAKAMGAEGHVVHSPEDLLALALKNVFVAEEYQIEEAGNGMQAISMCQRSMHDLVLMDAMMPEVDGFTACERIRSLPGGTDTPVLMITALDNEE